MKLRIILSSFENWACAMKYGQNLEVVLYHLTSLPGAGKGMILQSWWCNHGVVRYPQGFPHSTKASNHV